jgi:membrane protease YdiL (CAAX protease family)
MSEAIAADESPPSLPLRVWRNPITQLIVRLVFFLLVGGVIGFALVKGVPVPKPQGGIAGELAEGGATPWLRLLIKVLPAILAYWLTVRLLEGRKVHEFAPRKAPVHLATGWLVGMGILVASAIALAIPGYYSVQGTNAQAPLLTPLLVLGVGAGVLEEILFRGILYRLVEDTFGSWAAVVVSAIFFGLVHLGNPNATWWSSLAIAIEAGLLLGMAYAWTRSLWFVIALHAAWNFTQGPLLGIAVSGIAVDGLLKSTLTGPPMLSGGEFGAEGSIITMVICVAVAVYFTRKAIASGRIVSPFWRRRGPDGFYVTPQFEAAAPGLLKQ